MRSFFAALAVANVDAFGKPTGESPQPMMVGTMNANESPQPMVGTMSANNAMEPMSARAAPRGTNLAVTPMGGGAVSPMGGGAPVRCPNGNSWYGPGQYCISSNVYYCNSAGSQVSTIQQNCGSGGCRSGSPGVTVLGGGGSVRCPSGQSWGGPGDYCISDNLYTCNQQSQNGPTMKQNCGMGCVVAPPGQRDTCAVPKAYCVSNPTPAPPPPPRCPTGNGWYGQGTYCLNDDVYRCSRAGGNAQLSQQCSRGCAKATAYGGGGGSPTCPTGQVWGGPGPYCINDNIYQCNNQRQYQPQISQTCSPLGCVNAPPGKADYCKPVEATCN